MANDAGTHDGARFRRGGTDGAIADPVDEQVVLGHRVLERERGADLITQAVGRRQRRRGVARLGEQDQVVDRNVDLLGISRGAQPGTSVGAHDGVAADATDLQAVTLDRVDVRRTRDHGDVGTDLREPRRR